MPLLRAAPALSLATLTQCFEQPPFYDFLANETTLLHFSHFVPALRVLLPSSPAMQAVFAGALGSLLACEPMPRGAPDLVPLIWSTLDRPAMQAVCEAVVKWARADQEPLHALNSLIGFVAESLPADPPLALPAVPAALHAALDRGAEALPALLVALARSPTFRELLLIELRAFCGRSTNVALAATAFLHIASRADDIDEFVRAHLMDGPAAQFPRRSPAAVPADLERPREWLAAIVEALPNARAIAAGEVPPGDSSWVRAVRPGMLA
jgi:hypothetical protein